MKKIKIGLFCSKKYRWVQNNPIYFLRTKVCYMKIYRKKQVNARVIMIYFET